MNRAQRILAVVSLVAAGVSVPLAVQQVAEANAVEAAAVLDETQGAVVEAAYALKDLGHTPDQIVTLLTTTSGVDGAIVEPVALRGILADDRDPRAKRSVSVTIPILAESVASATTHHAEAMCEPLTLSPGLAAEHARCIASWAALGGRSMCSSLGTIGTLVTEHVTPPQAERLTAGLAADAEVIIDQGAARLAALGLWACADGPPVAAPDPPNPNMSAP